MFFILLCSTHVINYINRFPNIESILQDVPLAMEHFYHGTKSECFNTEEFKLTSLS